MTGILFLARLGSTRLQDKQLLKASGKTMMEWLLLRFMHEFKNEIENKTVQLIIATSVKPENKLFEIVLGDLPVKVFYGNDENIPLRQIECADALQLDNIISIDGDDILVSTFAARKIFQQLNEEKKVFAKTSGLPLGMNCSGYAVSFLKESFQNADSEKLETGWGRIFSPEKITDLKLGNYESDFSIRMTLDYDLDARFFTTVIETLNEKTLSISDDELINFILTNHFHEINNSLNETYWNNFNNQMKKENQK